MPLLPICVRCTKPIAPGTAAPAASDPTHARCAQLAAIELQERAQDGQADAATTRATARELAGEARRRCAVCGNPLASASGVLFQGEDLVHVLCWQEPARGSAGEAIPDEGTDPSSTAP